MINSVAGIILVNFLDNFFTIGVVVAILSWCVMYVTGTGKYPVFHFAIVTESLLYHSIIPTRKKYENSSLYVHQCYTEFG